MIHPLESRDTHFKCRRKLHLTSASHVALHLSGFLLWELWAKRTKKNSVSAVWEEEVCDQQQRGTMLNLHRNKWVQHWPPQVIVIQGWQVEPVGVCPGLKQTSGPLRRLQGGSATAADLRPHRNQKMNDKTFEKRKTVTSKQVLAGVGTSCGRCVIAG